MSHPTGGSPRVTEAPDPPISEDPPSCKEVERVVSELQKGLWGPYRAAQGGWREHEAVLCAAVVQLWSTSVVPPVLEET